MADTAFALVLNLHQPAGAIQTALLCAGQKSLQRWSLKRQVKTRLAAVERLGFLR